MKSYGYISACLIFFIVFSHANLSAQEFAEAELKRKQIVERMDKHGLRFRNTAVVEKSTKMLHRPKSLGDLEGFVVAKTPPEVEFAIVPLNPRYLIKPPKDYHHGVWSNWSQGTYYEPTQKFYAAVGSHGFYKPRLHLVEYDSKTRTIRTLPEINGLMGRADDPYGDGKIHGWLDFFNGSDLFFCTYWCKYPEPSEEEFQAGYEGGAVLSYNVITGQFTNYGVPMKRSSWPYHRMDTKRGLMFGVGMFGEFLCYDVRNRETRYAGYLPEGMRWFWRTMLIDEETGFVYTSNNLESDSLVHFVRYEPVKNRFFKMESCVPANSITGERGQMRAHTKTKSKAGWFIGVVLSTTKAGTGGQLFKFYPAEDRVEDLGLCWPGDQRYTASLALSPDEKYLYYIPAAHGKSHLEGTPVVQYNVHTGERKVIVFLFEYFYEKYGYIPGGTFSIKLDEKGEKLFVLFNGVFGEFDPKGGDMFGDPSVMVIHIPESERK